MHCRPSKSSAQVACSWVPCSFLPWVPGSRRRARAWKLMRIASHGRQAVGHNGGSAVMVGASVVGSQQVKATPDELCMSEILRRLLCLNTQASAGWYHFGKKKKPEPLGQEAYLAEVATVAGPLRAVTPPCLAKPLHLPSTLSCPDKLLPLTHGPESPIQYFCWIIGHNNVNI